MKAAIGSLVLCHILSNNPNADKINQNQENQAPKVQKVLGKMIGVASRKGYIENLEKKEVKEIDVPILLVQETSTNNVFEIKKSSCMPVVPETAEERDARLHPKVKKTIKVETKYDENGDKISEKQVEPVTLQDQISAQVGNQIKATADKLIETKEDDKKEEKKVEIKQEASIEEKQQSEPKLEIKKLDNDNKTIIDYLIK